MKKKYVRFTLYKNMDYVDYTETPYEGQSINYYVDYCNKFASDQGVFYDMIEVDDGRMVLIPMSDESTFVMLSDIIDGEFKGTYHDFKIVQGQNVIDIVDEK